MLCYAGVCVGSASIYSQKNLVNSYSVGAWRNGKGANARSMTKIHIQKFCTRGREIKTIKGVNGVIIILLARTLMCVDDVVNFVISLLSLSLSLSLILVVILILITTSKSIKI